MPASHVSWSRGPQRLKSNLKEIWIPPKSSQIPMNLESQLNLLNLSRICWISAESVESCQISQNLSNLEDLSGNLYKSSEISNLLSNMLSILSDIAVHVAQGCSCLLAPVLQLSWTFIQSKSRWRLSYNRLCFEPIFKWILLLFLWCNLAA